MHREVVWSSGWKSKLLIAERLGSISGLSLSLLLGKLLPIALFHYFGAKNSARSKG